MEKLERLEQENKVYKKLIVQYKVAEILKEIATRGLEPVLADLVELGIETEMAKRHLEERLRHIEGVTIKIDIPRR